ncbi:MAG: MBL fold metallo-hydrolase [Candidatus Dadabacteria bacterium]|nr:MBL fold metallo-hydrolase [Candidatus Dadabacteria bacterium]
MAAINEISENVYRISIHVKDFDMQFNHFLIKDDEPLLYHAGMRRMFPELKDAVSKIIDPKRLKWISWSHFEVDEVGGLNEWLQVAPNAQPVCSLVGALVNLSDFSDREPKGMQKGERFETGKYRFTFHPTPHLPHGWDAGMLFEEKNKILFCSDLFHQMGDVEPIISSDDIIERTNNAMVGFQSGPLMDYVPYTANTKRLLNELAEFKPEKLAVMHGSSFEGDGAQLLKELDGVFKSTFG